MAWLLELFLFIAWPPTTLIFLPSSNTFNTSSYEFTGNGSTPWIVIDVPIWTTLISLSTGFTKSLNFSL